MLCAPQACTRGGPFHAVVDVDVNVDSYTSVHPPYADDDAHAFCDADSKNPNPSLLSEIFFKPRMFVPFVTPNPIEVDSDVKEVAVQAHTAGSPIGRQ